MGGILNLYMSMFKVACSQCIISCIFNYRQYRYTSYVSSTDPMVLELAREINKSSTTKLCCE